MLARRRSRSVLSDATCRVRSSISCLSEALLGVGETLVTAGWGVTSEMRSAQRCNVQAALRLTGEVGLYVGE
jgi:hypothetical protein